jgi:hypothetical protein
MSIVIAVVVALAVYFLLRMRKGKKVASLSSSSDALERWLKDALPGVVAQHLASHGLDRAQVARTLGGDPDPSVVSTLEQHVKSVQIEYQRDAHNGAEVDVTARVRFEDGAEEIVRTRMPFADIPSSVRDDFDKKATTRAFRTWDFPWATSQ